MFVPRASAAFRSKPKNVTSGCIVPRKRVQLLRAELAAQRARHRFHRIHDGVRVSAQQLAANEQHELARRRVRAAQAICAELGVTPFIKRANVTQRRRVRRADVALRFPELPEVAALQVCRVFVPLQLASHLVIEAHHVALDERSVALEHHGGVRQDLVEAGQQPVLRQLAEWLVHRLREFRRNHDGLDGIIARRVVAPCPAADADGLDRTPGTSTAGASAMTKSSAAS